MITTSPDPDIVPPSPADVLPSRVREPARDSTPQVMTLPDDPDVPDDTTLEAVVGLLDDEHVRTILTATSGDALSAKELSERCDVSQATIYRRVERLTAAGLVDERTRPRADGHHDTVYVATLDEVSIRLRNGELRFDLERRGDDVADRLTRLWEDF
ncbi:helix-turn-helix domain-containing protein [Haloarcula sp. H-GB4]|nr:helix-turn-helix domain-containing protein [Haloarcula sp. H-GB4]MDQ2074063.1 helix-turn-helix domain-containing protein [Haloarcula sp. H-GB4]